MLGCWLSLGVSSVIARKTRAAIGRTSSASGLASRLVSLARGFGNELFHLFPALATAGILDTSVSVHARRSHLLDRGTHVIGRQSAGEDHREIRGRSAHCRGQMSQKFPREGVLTSC